MSGNYGLVSSVSQFEAFVDRLLAAGSPFGFDLETGYDGPDTAKAAVQPDRPESKIVGFSFSGDPGWARYLALADSRGEYLISSEVVPGLWRLLRSGKAVAANAKFEARWTARLFREWAAGPGAGTQEAEQIAATQGYVPWHADTMLMSYVAAEYPSHGLKFLTQEVFSHDQAELLSLFPGLPKNRSKSLRFNALELTPAVVSYACEDAAWTLALYRHFLPSVKDSMIYKTEMAIMPILARMEDAGIVFDWSGMVQASREVGQFLVAMRAQVMADLSALVGHEVDINLGSPAQVGKVLYEDLGLPVSNRTATGNPSTDAGTLGMLADRYPVVQAMLDFKEVSTLQARYLTKFPAEFNYAADGRAHPNHMQAVVPSGRFSVNDPGYQQLPKKYRYEIATDNEGLEGGSVVQVRDGKQVLDLNFRNFVGSPQGARIIGFDYSQVELRVLAGESGEPALLRAFESGADVHKATAALLFGVGVDQVSPDQRQQAKGANFSLMYGAGPKNLSEQLRISLEQARELYDTYFRVYSSVGAWKESQVAFGRQQGFVRTKFGRKIVIREFGSPDSWIQAKGERLCVNAPIQGSAADYMKIAMVRADAAIKSAGLQDRVQLVMNIHDALEFYVSDEIATADLIEILSPAVSFPVPGWPPILAEWHEGQRWGEVRDIDLSEISSAGTSSGQAEQSQTTERDSAALEPQGVVEVRRAQESPLQVDAQAVEQGSEGSAQTVYVDLEQLPYETEYRDFLEWARSRPGTANVVVRVEGQEVKVGRFALSVSDSGEVATILTGARIVLGAGSVDRDALAGSIDF